MGVGAGIAVAGIAMGVGSASAAASQASAEKYQALQMREARETEAQYRHDAMVTDSNNRLEATKDQNQTMRYAIMKNSQDFQFQVLAWLTNQIESLDVKSQIAMKDAEVRIAQIQSDERVQTKQLENDAHELDIRQQEINGVDTGSLFA